MSRYQRITTEIWRDERFTKLTDDGRLLYFYILTCPHGNPVGLFVLRPGYAACDLQWLQKRFRESLQELIAHGLIEWDENASVVLIPRHLKYNPIFNANQAKHAALCVKGMPRTPLANKVLAQLTAPYHETITETIAETVSGTVSASPTPIPLPIPTTTTTPPVSPQAPDGATRGRFQKPTVQEAQTYLDELGESRFTGQEFVDANEAKGWKVGRNQTPMKDWKAAVRTWRTQRDKSGEVNPVKPGNGKRPFPDLPDWMELNPGLTWDDYKAAKAAHEARR